MTTPADFAFLRPLRVRWNECDAQGIVFNVNYFLYYDIAVWEWTRALGYARRDEAPRRRSELSKVLQPGPLR